MKKSSTSDFVSKESSVPNRSENDTEYDLYIGLDVHKASIVVAVAERGRGSAQYRSEISNTPKAVRDLISRLEKDYSTGSLLYCYEAGPSGYVLYHQLTELEKDCVVVAPSLIPRRPGDRIKTDRRDSVNLAASLRSGDLTYINVPSDDQESMRDLTRARSDMKNQERAARQQLNAFVLHHGFHWPSGKRRWCFSRNWETFDVSRSHRI
jgi:transposase